MFLGAGAHWPEIQTKDYVPLPAGYGHGSSTLRNWIELNMERDRINKELNKYDSEKNSLNAVVTAEGVLLTKFDDEEELYVSFGESGLGNPVKLTYG